MLPISTPTGSFRVWTKRIGNNPRIKLLLLHGGPGFTHEYFELFDSYLPAAGIEYYYYDQLGSYYSDQPEMSDDMLALPRFVDEVEQVRRALGLDRSNFYLLGHSWGGCLAIEYALQYQAHLKGLIISNMMASIPQYNEHAERVLMPSMDQAALAEIRQLEAAGRHEEPRYMELLLPNHYEHHVLRMPAAEWPEPVNRAFKHMNASVYVPMQGPSELGAGGKLTHWDRTADLQRITVPALTNPAGVKRQVLGVFSQALCKPMAEVSSGKVAGPFNTLCNMVLSHATEEGAAGESAVVGAKSLVDNLKSMLAKPKAKAA